MEPTMSSTTETTSVLSPQEKLFEELYTYCSPSSGNEITEEGLRKIIHRRGWSWSPSKKLRVKDLNFFGRLLFSDQLTEGIVETVLQFFPVAARLSVGGNKIILSVILVDKCVTPNLVKILIEAYPQSVHHIDDDGITALHCLCDNHHLDASDKLQILELLLQKSKRMLKISTREDGSLPIHYASIYSSTPVPFMQKLIEAYPESVIKSVKAAPRLTPLHIACFNRNVKLVQVLVQANSKCLNALAAPNIGYPINSALTVAYEKGKIIHSAVSVVKFLVNFPKSKVASQEFRGCLPFHLACLKASNARGSDRNSLILVKVLFDAFPKAIMHSRLRRDMHRRGSFHPRVMEFLQDRLVVALPYIEVQELFSPLLPLHSLILNSNSCCLGSIKLLVEGNPAAVQTPDKDGAVALHLAVKLHCSSEVVQVLINHDSDRKTLSIADSKGNTALHYACLSANHEIIALLLNRYGAMSVSKRNLDGKLPIQLLFETNSVVDRDSTRYIESIFHLLRAFPDIGTYL